MDHRDAEARRRKSGFLSGGEGSPSWLCVFVVKILAAVWLFAGAAGGVCGATLRVPQDYPTIQGALDTAAEGDEVIVSPGRYREGTWIVIRKDIVLRSVDPTSPTIVASTILDGNQEHAVVVFSGTETSACVLAGFTITGGKDGMGAGITGYGTDATIEYNLIVGNVATGYSLPPFVPADGGGIMGCHLVRNNIIAYNRAEYLGQGGGASACGILVNNVFYGNYAQRVGSAIYFSGTIRNNIIWSNQGGSAVGSPEAPSYCCIQDWDRGREGEGIIDMDPRFVDPENGDFRLRPDSPCIDAGGFFEGVTTDFEGDPRPYRALPPFLSRGDGSGFDIGVDEFIGQAQASSHLWVIH